MKKKKIITLTVMALIVVLTGFVGGKFDPDLVERRGQAFAYFFWGILAAGCCTLFYHMLYGDY